RSETLVLSIAAGVQIATLEALVPGRPVVRAMPNTPALVGLGASAIAPGRHASDLHLDLAARLLGAVGIVVRVDESALDAVTGLSGSGPAYVFLVAEAMIEAGVLVGLPRDVSERLVVQTLLGSATLLAQRDDGPEALRAAVTSPGGTTAAGLRELEAARLRAAILGAVSAAARRKAGPRRGPTTRGWGSRRSTARLEATRGSTATARSQRRAARSRASSTSRAPARTSRSRPAGPPL